jgi:DNA-binding MarR family transcriptional regulator
MAWLEAPAASASGTLIFSTCGSVSVRVDLTNEFRLYIASRHIIRKPEITPMKRRAHMQPEQPTASPERPDHQDYRMLADFRYLIRHFLKFSEDAAHGFGLTSQQHQALLAIKGFPGGGNPTVGELAERLCILHHSTVELIDRLVDARLITRAHAADDRRKVRLSLTEASERHLASLSAIHLEELSRLRPMLLQILDQSAAYQAPVAEADRPPLPFPRPD